MLRYFHFASDSEDAMQMKHARLTPEARARRDHATRLKRFAAQFERWCRGEPVRSYDTKWLAYLKEHQLEQRQSNGKLERAPPASRVTG